MKKVLKELYSDIIKKYTNETIYCFEIQTVKLQKKNKRMVSAKLRMVAGKKGDEIGSSQTGCQIYRCSLHFYSLYLIHILINIVLYSIF